MTKQYTSILETDLELSTLLRNLSKDLLSRLIDYCMRCSYHQSVQSENVEMRPMMAALIRSKGLLNIPNPRSIRLQTLKQSEMPPQPFDNMPFSIPNRYVATLFFSVFFGIGLWAPFIIVWYSMAKRTL